MSANSTSDKTTLWTTIITITMTVLLIGLLIFFNEEAKSNESASSNSPSKLTAAETNYDFGTISMANGKVSKVFRVINNTDQPIEARKLYTSCMCTKATAKFIEKNLVFGPYGMPAHKSIPSINKMIEPGENVDIEAVFDPNAHGPAGVGPIEREVILETGDGRINFKFKANVIP